MDTRLVSNMPDKTMALTNCVYVSLEDTIEAPQVMINHFVWNLCRHSQVQPGCIALNSGQRMSAKVSLMDPVKLETFDNNELHAIDTLIYELVDTNGVVVNDHGIGAIADDLDEFINDIFCGQVITEGQILVFSYQEKNYRIRAKYLKNIMNQDMFRAVYTDTTYCNYVV
jgi:hypothetical protein